MELNELRNEIAEADAELAELFRRRMRFSEAVAVVKAERGLPIEDRIQEVRVLERGRRQLGDEELWPYYSELLTELMRLSRKLQAEYIGAHGAGIRDGLTSAWRGQTHDDRTCAESSCEGTERKEPGL